MIVHLHELLEKQGIRKLVVIKLRGIVAPPFALNLLRCVDVAYISNGFFTLSFGQDPTLLVLFPLVLVSSKLVLPILDPLDFVKSFLLSSIVQTLSVYVVVNLLHEVTPVVLEPITDRGLRKL